MVSIVLADNDQNHRAATDSPAIQERRGRRSGAFSCYPSFGDGMNLLEVTKVAERLKRVAKVLDDATSIRLAALIEERGRQPMEDSDEARRYEEGFKHGLNAGLRVSKTEFADLDAELLCEAFNGDIED